MLTFPSHIRVQDNQLIAILIPETENGDGAQTVSAAPGLSCQEMLLDRPVDFYIPEHAAAPGVLKPGQELWVEVTVPPKGPPRPLQLAMKDNGVWKPLGLR